MIIFIECLATEIVETYKHLARVNEEQEKQFLQNDDKIAIFDVF